MMDWDRSIVVMAGMKAGRTSGHNIRIGTVRRKDGHIVVPVLEVRPGPDDILVPVPERGSVVGAVSIPRSDNPVRIEETSIDLGPAPFLARLGFGLDPGTWELLSLTGGQALVILRGEVEQLRILPVNDQPTMRMETVTGGPAFGTSQSVAPVSEGTEAALVKAARESGFMGLKDLYGQRIRDIDQRQRTLRVTVDDRVKEVTVLDDPSDPVPLAFERMWKAFRDTKKGASVSARSSVGGSFSFSASAGHGGSATN